MSSLGGMAAIAGIGQTEFSKESGRSELQLACEAVKAAIDDAGLRPQRYRRHGDLHDGRQRGDRGRPQRRHRRPDVLHPRAPRRWSGGGHGGAGGDGGGNGHSQRCRVLPRVQRTVRVPVRRIDGALIGPDAVVARAVRPVRVVDACSMGRTACPALHVDLRGDQRRLREDIGRGPRPRGAQSRRMVLPASHHSRGSPELPVGHRTGTAASRLLPGKRWRRRVRHHQRRARAQPPPAARSDHEPRCRARHSTAR